MSKLKLKKPRQPRRSKLERLAAEFGEALGEALTAPAAQFVADTTAAIDGIDALPFEDMNDEQRAHGLERVAIVRGYVEASQQMFVSAEQATTLQWRLDRVEARLRGLRPIVASIMGIERYAELVRTRPTPAAEIQQALDAIDALTNSDTYRELAELDPEAHAASAVRVAEVQRLLVQQQGD